MFDLRHVCNYQVWEQELYQELDYKTPLAWFHTFEAHTHVAGLSFADERCEFKIVLMSDSIWNI